jgi:arylsulfatase A-like enzyme
MAMTMTTNLLLHALCSATVAAATAPAEDWNVLCIAVDDLNDAVGALGDSTARTPNIDRLAASGMTFTCAHAAATICAPSRAALLTGCSPLRTRVLDNETSFRTTPGMATVVTLPQAFRRHGYRAVASGKLFHTPRGPMGDEASWDEIIGVGIGTQAPPPERLPASGITWPPTKPVQRKSLDWGPLDLPIEETFDHRNAVTAAALLDATDPPRFIAWGGFRPHIPMYAPAPFFALHPRPSILLPEVPADLDRQLPTGAAPYRDRGEWSTIHGSGRLADAVQAYRACVSYADACVGVLLDALDRSPQRDRTVVVLWSDHGFHLGDRNRWGKNTLWDRASRVPLIIRVPGLTRPGTRCDRVVSLLDLYPTLCQLTGVPAPEGLAGRSLAPLLADPQQPWPHAALTWNLRDGGISVAVRDDTHRLIRYADGTCELYDHRRDPAELTNLAQRPEAAERIAALAACIPTETPAR